jgi:DNA-binding IclR family transcriptional regulator
MARSLVTLGYLQYAADKRKYRLGARVLNLGYAAVAHSDVQRLLRPDLQSFADLHKVHVALSTRDDLSMVVLESCASAQAPIAMDVHVGARSGLACSPIGWALLAALPAAERYHLLDCLQRGTQREWSGLQRSCEGIAQVQDSGFCASPIESTPEVVVIAVPLVIAGYMPLVLACAGSSTDMTRARVDCDLGPRLVRMATALQNKRLA